MCFFFLKKILRLLFLKKDSMLILASLCKQRNFPKLHFFKVFRALFLSSSIAVDRFLDIGHEFLYKYDPSITLKNIRKFRKKQFLQSGKNQFINQFVLHTYSENSTVTTKVKSTAEINIISKNNFFMKNVQETDLAPL